MQQILPTPRFVTCISHDEDGNIKEYSWQPDKIHVEQYLADDMLMLQNVFEGKILSPSIYPLIYETKTAQKETGLRSLEFYREVIQNNSLYTSLNGEEKLFFLIGIRDLFVASCRNLLNEDEKELLRRIVDIVDPHGDDQDIISKDIDGISITPYPTAKNKMVRFVPAKTENMSDECFIRNELNLLVGFVDPRELSYHNLENIINLDSLFQKNLPEFTISGNIEKHSEHEVYGFEMTDKTKILLSLDSYGLYTQPLNKLSRGGERFIFSSERLSQSLTECIRTCIREHQPQLITPKFRFVNYVFRYNKFKPGDHKFSSHYDTPYYDPLKKHYSKYTLILYLTSGTADPVLSLNKGNVNITQIDTKGQIRGVIFDQKYEHEGRSFAEGDKIFLRSELVFEFDDDDGLSFDADISKKFNIACYMTKQSLFNEELERYACECFNQVAEARLNLAKSQITDDYLLRKTFEGVSFITNGYDYWFQNNISLKDAAVLALLDHFNCKFDSPSGKHFNSLTCDEVVKLNLESVYEIFEYMTQVKKQDEEKGMMEMEVGVGNKQLKKDTNQKPDFEEENKQNKEESQSQLKLKYQSGLLEEEKMELEGVEDWNQFKERYNNNVPFEEAEDKNDEDYVAPDEDEDTNDDNDNDDGVINDEEQKKNKENDTHDKEIDNEASNSESSEEEEPRNICCDYHAYYDENFNYYFDPARCNDLVKVFNDVQDPQIEKLWGLKEKFNIFIFGSEIEVNKNNMIVTESIIKFNEQMPKINFAACWNMGYKPKKYIKSKTEDITGYANIPPIPYRVYENGYHLKIELFNNSFVRRHEEKFEKYYFADPIFIPEGEEFPDDEDEEEDDEVEDSNQD